MTTEKFLGCVGMAFGALVLGLCGLCTVKFVGPPFWGMIKGSQVAGGMLVESLVFAAVFDAIPIVVGIAILRAGWRKYHE